MDRMPKKGEWVKLKGDKNNFTAQVSSHMRGHPDGVRLDRRLGGFQFWTKHDLEPAYPANRSESKGN